MEFRHDVTHRHFWSEGSKPDRFYLDHFEHMLGALMLLRFNPLDGDRVVEDPREPVGGKSSS